MKASAGLRAKMLSNTGGSFPQIMNGCFAKIYDGIAPTSADSPIAAGNNLLVTIYKDNDGSTSLTFENEPVVNAAVSPANIHLSKNLAEVWEGTNVASGVATFFRLVLPADDGLISTTQERIQGSVAVSGADLNLSSTNLTLGASQKIKYLLVNLPTL